MSKVGSLIALSTGGAAVFAAAYAGVAASKGASMREIPPLSWIARPEPAAAGETPPPTGAEPAPSSAAAPYSMPLAASVLDGFVLPSPYDAGELHTLEKQLRDGVARVRAEDERLARLEGDLQEWQASLELRATELEALRQSLDAAGGAPAAAPESKATAEPAVAPENWRTLAPLFEEGDPEDVAERIAEFDPAAAVQILRALDPERAGAILNALPKERYKSFLDAWLRAGK